MARTSPKGFNRHHVAHTRAEFVADGMGYRIRTLGAFILTIPTDDHKELHASVAPLSVPSRSLGKIMLATHQSLPEMPRIDKFEAMKEVLWDLSDSANGRLGEEAFSWVCNLVDQSQFFKNVIRTN